MTDRTPATLYPLESLAQSMGESLASLGRLLGVSGSVWKQYRDLGVTERVADRLAVKAGLHPFEVWPEMVAHQQEAVSKTCADERCGLRFIPTRSTHLYCSDRCRYRRKIREQRRRRYHSDPEWRAAVLEANDAYRRENLRAIAIQKRTYRAGKAEVA